MIFFKYEKNQSPLENDPNAPQIPAIEKKRIFPSRPIPLPARRNYLLPDRIKLEKERQLADKIKAKKLFEKKLNGFRVLVKVLLANFGMLFVSLMYVIVGAYM